MVRKGVPHAKVPKSYLQTEVVREEVEIGAAVVDGDVEEVGDADYYYRDHRIFVVSQEGAEVNRDDDAAASVEVAADADELAAASEARTSFVAAVQEDGGMLPAPWAGGEGGQVAAHMVVHTLL